jgi:hypothetical protein
MRSALITTLWLLLLSTAGGAQLAELQPGTRVRLRAPDVVAGRLEGVVVARGADTLALTRPNAVPVGIPLSAITAAEVSRGKSRRTGAVRGALWGAGVGVALGVLAAVAPDDCSGEECEDVPSDVETIVIMPIASALTGAAIGAVVGAERWERLAIPTRAALAPGAARRLGARRLAAVVTLHF